MLFYFRFAVLIPTTPDRFYQTYKIIWIYITDITDTECICLRNLPRVNNKTLFFQLHIKRFEIKLASFTVSVVVRGPGVNNMYGLISISF